MSRSREPTIVHVDTETIRAKIGVDELYEKPTLTLSASYAVPKASTSSDDVAEEGSRDGWVFGEQLDKERGEPGFEGKWEVRWPFRPVSIDQEEDWDGREYILKHTLTSLGVTISSNTHPLLLIPPPSPSYSISTQALYTQIAFEKLNTPSFSLLPPSLAAIFALGQTTGVVVQTSYDRTVVNVIIDSIVREQCSAVVPLGIKHCEEHFVGLLMADAALDRELRTATGKDTAWEAGEKEKHVRELADFVWRECTDGDDIEVVTATGVKSVIPGKEGEEETFDVAKKLVGDTAPAAAPSHKSKKQQAALAQKAASAAAQAQANAEAALAADVITCKIPSIPDKTFDLGPVRHRLVEVLFKGNGGESVWEGIGRAVEHPSVGWDVRQSVWEGLGVIGDLARIRSFAPALSTYLSPFLVSSPELSEVQPSKLRLLSIPDYFANYKGSTSDLAPFLGATISAKMILADAGLSINKIQYNAMGPAAIYTSKDEPK